MRSRNKKTGQTIAIKIIDLEATEDEIEDIQNEVHVQLSVNSPHVVAVHGSFVQGSKLWIIMEYLSGGSILDLMKPGALDEQYIAVILKEMLLALDYLHSENKIHRMENTILTFFCKVTLKRPIFWLREMGKSNWVILVSLDK